MRPIGQVLEKKKEKKSGGQAWPDAQLEKKSKPEETKFLV